LFGSTEYWVWCAKEAASAGAKLLCFPEAFSYVGIKDGDSVRVAQPLDGPIMTQYCSLARSYFYPSLHFSSYFNSSIVNHPTNQVFAFSNLRLLMGVNNLFFCIFCVENVNTLHVLMHCRESSIWLSLGGFQEKGSDPQHLCNTHVIVDETGKIRSSYRKIHL